MAQLVLVCIALAGCQQVPEWPWQTSPVQNTTDTMRICLVDPPASPPVHNCHLEHWLSYWSAANTIPWAERKAMIEQQDDSIDGQLNKILLSQPVNTPYQDRLRAQSWLDKLLPQLSEEMGIVLKAIVYQPSQQLLELESALTVLSRINAQQARTLEAQQQQLQKQKTQLEQLMKIEANIAETKRVNQP